MSKYEGLGGFLKARAESQVPMSFEEIERVTGARLPPSAGKYTAWWSNNPSNNVMTRVWLEAGFRAENVDLGARKLVFRRFASDQAPAPTDRPCGEELLNRIIEGMRGTVTIAPGVDITEPTGEVWAAQVE